jgi:hypothetical protein
MAAYRSGRCEAAEVDGGGAVDGDLRIGACACELRATQNNRHVGLSGSGQVGIDWYSTYQLVCKEALRAFEALKRTPEFFRRYLQRYLAYAELGSRAALDDTLAHVFNDSGYRIAWGRLLPADKAVLRAPRPRRERPPFAPCP